MKESTGGGTTGSNIYLSLIFFINNNWSMYSSIFLIAIRLFGPFSTISFMITLQKDLKRSNIRIRPLKFKNQSFYSLHLDNILFHIQ